MADGKDRLTRLLVKAVPPKKLGVVESCGRSPLVEERVEGRGDPPLRAGARRQVARWFARANDAAQPLELLVRKREGLP
jgi:hypothetical protein